MWRDEEASGMSVYSIKYLRNLILVMGPKKNEKFRDYMSDCQLVNKNSAPVV